MVSLKNDYRFRRGAIATMTLADPRARLLLVIFGGLVVFYSSSGVSALKALYLLCLPVIGVRGCLSLTPLRDDGETAGMQRAAMLASGLMALMIAMSLPVAVLNNDSPTIWLRDVVPYLLIALSPLVAVDAARNITRIFLERTLLAAGLLATAGFVVWNVKVRHLAALPFGELLYPSPLLGYALFSYACAQLLFRRGGYTVVWGLVASVLLAAMLGAGSRLSLIMLVAPFVMLLGRGGLKRSLRTLCVIVAAALIVTLTVGIMAPALGISTKVVSDRVRLTESAILHPARDGSIKARFSEGSAAWRLFEDAPVLGEGPGHLYQQYFPGSGANANRFTVDSAVSVLAKFGVLGTGCFIAALVVMVLCVRRSQARDVRAAVTGFAAVTIVSFPVSNPFEDKGFGFAVMLLMALALRDTFETGGERDRRLPAPCISADPSVALGSRV